MGTPAHSEGLAQLTLWGADVFSRNDLLPVYQLHVSLCDIGDRGESLARQDPGTGRKIRQLGLRLARPLDWIPVPEVAKVRHCWWVDQAGLI